MIYFCVFSVFELVHEIINSFKVSWGISFSSSNHSMKPTVLLLALCNHHPDSSHRSCRIKSTTVIRFVYGAVYSNFNFLMGFYKFVNPVAWAPCALNASPVQYRFWRKSNTRAIFLVRIEWTLRVHRILNGLCLCHEMFVIWKWSWIWDSCDPEHSDKPAGYRS